MYQEQIQIPERRQSLKSKEEPVLVENGLMWWYFQKVGSVFYSKVDHWMMQFKSFHRHHGLWTIIPCTHMKTSETGGVFYIVTFSMFLQNKVGKSIFWVFWWHKNSAHACWIWDDYIQLGPTGLVSYLSSHIQIAHLWNDHCLISMSMYYLNYFS